jgi:hypothetical protein
MKRHQATIQAAEVVPLSFFMGDPKIGSITNGAMIEFLH